MRTLSQRGVYERPLERGSVTGEAPIHHRRFLHYGCEVIESRSLGCERQFGGKFLLRLITTPNTIAYKYREGKVESTLERELNVPELVVRKAVGIPLRPEMSVRLRIPQISIAALISVSVSRTKLAAARPRLASVGVPILQGRV